MGFSRVGLAAATALGLTLLLPLGGGVARAQAAAGGSNDSCQYANDRECDEPGIGTGACAVGTDATDCTGVGQNTCQYANDGECDEPELGTGFCEAGTDTMDCRHGPGSGLFRIAANDSCQYANDRECDEPGIGTGACALNTDATDCAGVGENTCQWANDGECDEPEIGTNACTAGTDTADCRPGVAGLTTPPPAPTGGNDSCQYARDNECDEPGIGTGACTLGTDATDCMGVGQNNCTFANDGECDEPGIGTGACQPGTDTADCRPGGEIRPATGPDSCQYARDNECDEPNVGTGLCAQGTDTTDCAAAYAGQTTPGKPTPPTAGGADSCQYARDNECDEPGIGTGLCQPGTDTTDCQAAAGATPGKSNALTGPLPEDALGAFQMLVEQQAPPGAFTWETAEALGMDGFVLTGVTMTPEPGEEPVRIGEFRVDRLDLQAIAAGEQPSFATFTVSGLRFSVSDIPDMAETAAMFGIDAIDAAISVDYGIDPATQTMSLNELSLDLADLGALTLAFTVEGVAPGGAPEMAMMTGAIRSAHLSYEDDSLLGKLLTGFAQDEGQSVDDFVAEGIQAMGEMAKTDPMVAPAATAFANFLRDFRSPRGPLTIAINPPEPVPFMGLMMSGEDPAAAVNMLGVTITYP